MLRTIFQVSPLFFLLIACNSESDKSVPDRGMTGSDECADVRRDDLVGAGSLMSQTNGSEMAGESYSHDIDGNVHKVVERIDTRVTGVVMSTWSDIKERRGGYARFITIELCDGDECEQRLYIQWLGGYPRGNFPQFQAEVKMPLGAWIDEMKEFHSLYPCNALEVQVKDVYPGPQNQVWCIDYSDRSSIEVMKYPCRKIERCN